MAEYIEREALKETLERYYCAPHVHVVGSGISAGLEMGIKGCLSLLDNAPAADVVEVVRCKDCKYWDCYGGEESHKGDCLELELDTCIYEDDFCSYGEKRVE